MTFDVLPLLAAATDHTKVLLALFIMLAAAKLMAEIFERIHQPAVVGEILAGVLIGPSVLNWVTPNNITETLADIGVIFLLFTVGLETKPAAILKVGKRAAAVAILGIIVPFIGGYLLMLAFGETTIQSLFVGTAMVATSVGITARVLGAMGLLDATTSRIILGAAVIDDILGLLVLTVVSSAASGSLNLGAVALKAFLAIAFTFAAVFGLAPLLTRARTRIERLRIGHSFFVFGMVLCLGLSVAAAFIGVAAIIGAFLAGMALAEASEHNRRMHRQTAGVTEFLVPFFLVNIGMQLQLDVFREPKVIFMALAVTLVAVLTKLIGCGLGALPLGKRAALQIGMGMVPRGEVGIVVAQIGLSLKVIDAALYGIVLFMAVATTLVAPPFLKTLFAGEELSTDKSEDVIADEHMGRLG